MRNSPSTTPRRRILDSSVLEPGSGCWVWTKCFGPRGYPAMTVNGHKYRGNRFSWEAFNGPIPKGICVLHRCDNRACVNPNHLFLGTCADNMADMIKKGRAKHDKGELASRAILTEAQVLKIRASKLPLRELAKKFGVHRNTIDNILRRETWTHI